MLLGQLTRSFCLRDVTSFTNSNSFLLFSQKNFLRTHHSTLSTVDRGTIFENVSLKLLQQHLSMSLRRIGGKEDGGIDLIGWWWIPDVDGPKSMASTPASKATFRARRRVRVVAQCKAEKKKPGPKYVRELEGVVYRYMARDAASRLSSFEPSDTEAKVGERREEAIYPQDEFTSTSGPIVAIFISESPFTKSTLLRAMSSSVPFLMVHIPPKPPKDEQVDDVDGGEEHSTAAPSPGSVVWNPALGGSHGIFKGKMEVRWSWKVDSVSPSTSATSVADVTGTPSLWFEGQRLPSWTPDSEKLPSEPSAADSNIGFNETSEASASPHIRDVAMI